MSKFQTSNDGEHSLIEDQDNKLSVEDQYRLEIFSNLIDYIVLSLLCNLGYDYSSEIYNAKQ